MIRCMHSAGMTEKIIFQIFELCTDFFLVIFFPKQSEILILVLQRFIVSYSINRPSNKHWRLFSLPSINNYLNMEA